MTAPGTPERLWAYSWGSLTDIEIHIRQEDALDAREDCRYLAPTDVAEYVRADVAEREAAKRAERAEAALDAVAREGWRACVLLAAARVSQEADRTYADADEACLQKAKSELIEELHEEAAALEDEARRLRSCVEADDAAREAGR